MSEDLSQLIASLSSSDVTERATAAETFSQMGEDSRAAAVALVRAVGDDEEVSEWAVAALEEMGAPDAEDVASLAELLADENPDVGYWSATLLGRIGESAAPATTQLIAALEQQDHASVAERAAWALGQIGPRAASATGALSKAGTSDNPRLARLAHSALESIRR